jgi:hypothetical protein
MKNNEFCNLEPKWNMDEPWVIHTHKIHHGLDLGKILDFPFFNILSNFP